MNALVPTQYDDIQPLLEQFVAMTQQGTHIYIAIDDLHGIVGSISLLIEAKMIRGGVQAGHIEDLVVHECAQWKGIWGELIDRALQSAQQLWCYKVILDCDENLAGYYERKGFEKNGVFMRKYLDQK